MRVVRLGERSIGRAAAWPARPWCRYLVIGGLSFGVWQEWWLALATLDAIACGLSRAVADRGGTTLKFDCPGGVISHVLPQ